MSNRCPVYGESCDGVVVASRLVSRPELASAYAMLHRCSCGQEKEVIVNVPSRKRQAKAQLAPTRRSANVA